MMRGDDYINKAPSERRMAAADRLAQLPLESWTPELFRARTAEFVEQSGIEVRLSTGQHPLPELDAASRFRYSRGQSGEYRGALDEARTGNKVVVVAVLQGGQVVGYGIAKQDDEQWTIEIIDVDVPHRRSNGLSLDFSVADLQFGVGVGHVIADALIRAVGRPVVADAESSEYIFRSLGFTEKLDAHSPFVLHLQ
jgi:hypothetical protein